MFFQYGKNYTFYVYSEHIILHSTLAVITSPSDLVNLKQGGHCHLLHRRGIS